MNAANGDHGREVYRFLRDDLGAAFIQLIPVVERGRPDLTITPQQFGRLLVEVFEDWVRHDVGDVFVQMFDTALAHWLGLDDVGMCVHATTCGSALVLEHNGDVYSCDHYVDPDHLLGNLSDLGDGRSLLDLVGSTQQVAFGRDKLVSLPADCRRCDVRFACNGGCPKDRFAADADGRPGLHHLCAGYQTFFRHVDRPMRVMADLVRRGQDAGGVMAWYAAHDARRAG
jgi:uncharacterized protein